MDELKNIAPKLSNLKKENPFGTPDKYFDTFSTRLQIKLEAEKELAPNKQRSIIRFLKPAIGLAASFALIIVLVYWPLTNFMSKQGPVATNVESNLKELEYEQMIEGIDENSFYSLLEETNGSTDFTSDDLENYLVANVSEFEIYSETYRN